MDFRFTEEQEMMRRTIQDFCRQECPPEYVKKCDREHEPPVEAFKALADLGFLGVNIPEEYGGVGASTVEVAILLEELGRGFLDLALWVFRVVTYGGHAIVEHGTPEQKQRFLPKVAVGECSVCFALTEPDSGSDAASITTTAKPDGDGFSITGQKVFCSGFKVSDYILMATRTHSEGRKHEGISNILVETKNPGIQAQALDTLGHWPLGTTLLFIDDAKVPKENLLGTLHEGWRNLMPYLEYERLSLSAARTGAAQAAFAEALEYAKEREQFGRPIGKFQAVSHKLADMQTMCEAARLLVYHYAWKLDQGIADRKDAAVLKLFTSETYKTVADMGLQVLGGYGYTTEYNLERHYRESRLGTIGAGTSEIQRNIISRALGL